MRPFSTILLFVAVASIAGAAWGQISREIPSGDLRPEKKLLEGARGKRSGPRDIRFAGGGSYLGGIDRQWSLAIGPPEDRRFSYAFRGINDVRLSGAYRVTDDGLAEFTGALEQKPLFSEEETRREIRFALNFAIIEGDVHFNVLARGDGPAYQHHRRWYAKRGESWVVSEERRLTFAPRKADEKTLAFRIAGERLYLDEKGMRQKEPLTREIVYRRDGDFWRAPRDVPTWLPMLLAAVPRAKDGDGPPPAYRLTHQSFADLNGFQFGDVE